MFSWWVENNSADFVVLFFSSSILEISSKSFFLENHTNLVSIVEISNKSSSIFFSLCMRGSFSVLVETSKVISIVAVSFTPLSSFFNINWRLLFPYSSITPWVCEFSFFTIPCTDCGKSTSFLILNLFELIVHSLRCFII